MCWLLPSNEQSYYGELSLFNSESSTGQFRTHVEGSTVFEGRTFYYLSAYWQAYQVWMVADESRLWEKLSFEPLTRFPKQSMASTDGNCGV